jgi:hypothetical protein
MTPIQTPTVTPTQTPVVTPTITPPPGKITVCHKGKNTLSIDGSAVPAHLAHGDSIGACD